jgi:hypothetical protein
VPFCTRRHAAKNPRALKESASLAAISAPSAWNMMGFSHSFAWSFTEARIGIITDGNAPVRQRIMRVRSHPQRATFIVLVI